MSSQPLFPFEGSIIDEFRRHGWFRTEKLLSSWYMLANDSLAVLIDTVKPKIVNLFAYGCYGTLRALLYDANWEAAFSNWIFGVVPSYQRGGAHYLPLKFGARISEPDGVEFDAGAKRLTMRGLHFFRSHVDMDPIESAISVDGYESGRGNITCHEDNARADWTISLLDDGLELTMTWPAGVENARWLTFWHPLFTHAGDNRVLGYENNSPFFATDAVTFLDDQGRMPRLSIVAPGAEIRVQPRSEPSLRGAYRLAVEIGASGTGTARIRVTPNPVTLDVNPHIDADRPQPIIMRCADRPEIEVDGEMKSVALAETDKGVWTGRIELADGEHFLVARTGGGRCVRRVFAHGDIREKMRRVGEAYLKLQYKDGSLAGLFPFVYLADTLEPVFRWWGLDEGSCMSYAIRIIWLLAALYEYLGDDRYKEAMFRKLAAHYEKCHKFEDGSVMPPCDLQPDGTMVPGSEEWPRPWNQFEAVMAYTMAYRVFKRHGDRDRATKCLEWAAAYAKTLIHMQRRDGGLHERYRFGTFTPCHENVFPMPQSLGLTEYIRALEEEKVAYLGMTPPRLRKFIADQLSYARSLPPHDLKMLSGAEASGNSSAWFVGFSAGRMLTRYIAPDDVRNDDKIAMDCAKLSAYLCALYPDYPQFYLIQGAVSVSQAISVPLAARFDGTASTEPGARLMGKGDMDDFQAAFMGLALLRHRNEHVGLLLARYAFASRLATAILPSGAVCECEIDVPGYRFRQTEYTMADVNAATLGVCLYQYATGEAMI